MKKGGRETALFIHLLDDQNWNLSPSWSCLGPPNRAVDGAVYGSAARIDGLVPDGHVMFIGFDVLTSDELVVQ